MKYIIIILSFIFLSCNKEDIFNPVLINNPKETINNTSGWYVSSYLEGAKDSTVLFSKYKVSFNEDPTCAERLKFIQPFSEVYAVWDTYDYINGTVMRIWTPGSLGFYNLDGEWYFYSLSKSKIRLFRLSNSGDIHQLIFEKL